MFSLGDGLVDQAEKSQPLLMPVPLLASLIPSSRAVVRVDQGVAFCWSGLHGLVDHGVDHRCWNPRRAPGPGSISQQTLYPPVAEISLATTLPSAG